MKNYDLLYKILRLSLDVDDAENFPKISGEEWDCIYELADKQTLLGIAYAGVCKLKPEQRPPIDIMFQWGSEAETIRGWNKILNEESVKITKFYESEGFATGILKGQANARLYPDPLLRQPGDIDIWVSGGKEKIVNLLKKKNLMQESLETGHHVHMVSSRPKVDVEVHYKPSSGNMNYFSSRRMLKYLNKEIENCALVAEGFYAPSIKFALVMQLSHIQRHFFGGGIGIRQLTDYFILLRSSTEDDRREISNVLKSFGLKHIAAAVMWLLQKIFHMDDSLLLCKPDARRGMQLLDEVTHGGNFGYHANENHLKWLFWWLNKRKKSLRHLFFDPMETLWAEIEYWVSFFRNTSVRIRERKLSLRRVR